jgi:hypothetical protein
MTFGAVMDAAGSERAVLCGISEGGPMCMLFAATYPARTAALILYGTYARMLRAAGYRFGLPEAGMETFFTRVEDTRGTGSVSADNFAPSLAHDVAFRQSWARFERLAVSPGGIKALLRMLYETDARAVLPLIRVPTLIVQREGDRVSRVQGARYIAERIQGAEYVELPASDHFPWVGNSDAILDKLEGFLAGVRNQPEPDRILTTVMFTDIVERQGLTPHPATSGVTCGTNTAHWSVSNSQGFAAVRSTRPATVSWRLLTGRLAASAVPVRSFGRRLAWACSFGRGFIPASAT